MVLGRFLGLAGAICVSTLLLFVAGCSSRTAKGITRVHLKNDGESAVTFLAIGVSEDELETAENRLSHPLPPKAVYSAVLSRTGNYWIRADVETDGYIVSRIDGPVRVSQGVASWHLGTVDAEPLYTASKAYPVAGRMSFSSN